MIECDDCRARLPALLDGELPSSDVTQLEAHLAKCADCAKAFAQCRALRKAASLSPPFAEIDLWSRISDELFEAPELDTAAEIRLMRQEMQTLHEEVAALRRDLTKRAPSPIRSTSLSLPDAPIRSLDPYRLV